MSKHKLGSRKKWMQGVSKSIKKRGTKGALRKELNVKAGAKIPMSKLEKAKHSGGPLLRKRAALAETFSKARKSKSA